MKALGKRLLSACMMVMLVVIMVVPAFAAGEAIDPLTGTIHHYQSCEATGNTGYLNLYTSSTGGVVRGGTALRSWTRTTSPDQYFKVGQYSKGIAYLCVQTAPTAGGSQYSLALNRANPSGNAIVWDKDAGARDSALTISYFNSGDTVILALRNYANEKLVCPASGSVANGTQFVFMNANSRIGWRVC